VSAGLTTLLGLVALVAWGAWAARGRSDSAAGPRRPLRWPALAMRDHVGWRELEERVDGYGPGRVAVVHCRSHAGENRLRFQPALGGSCLERSLRHGGERACAWACLGAGDCLAACAEQAMRLVDGLPVVDSARCTGCGDCLPACPRGVLGLQPAEARLVVT